MPRAKKAVAEAAAVVEKKAVETAAPTVETKPVEKKAAAKKTAAKKTTEKKTAAKETAEKKPAAKKTADVEKKVVIQANGSEAVAAELVEKAMALADVKSVKKVDIYVKPEVNKVYYVINGDTFGDFDLF